MKTQNTTIVKKTKKELENEEMFEFFWGGQSTENILGTLMTKEMKPEQLVSLNKILIERHVECKKIKIMVLTDVKALENSKK